MEDSFMDRKKVSDNKKLSDSFGIWPQFAYRQVRGMSGANEKVAVYGEFRSSRQMRIWDNERVSVPTF